MLPQPLGDPELGSHAVGAGNEDGIFQAAHVKVEEGPEAPDISQDLLAKGGFDKRFYSFDEKVGAVDVDAGILIRKGPVFHEIPRK